MTSTERISYAVLVFLALAALALAVVAWNAALNPHPALVSFDPAHIDIAEPLCVGEDVTGLTSFTVNGPSVIETTVSVVDIASGFTVPGSTVVRLPRNRDVAETLLTPVSYSVNVPPGNYKLLVSASAANMGSAPAFFRIDFSVVDCTGSGIAPGRLPTSAGQTPRSTGRL